jgi:hypothetical protein
MKRSFSAWSSALTAVIVAGALAIPASSFAQQRAVPRGSGGSSQPSGGGGGNSGGGNSGGGSSDGGSKSGGQSGSSTPRGAHRIPPGDSGSNRGGGGDRTARDGSPSGDTGNATAGAPSSTPTDPAPGESRPRNGQPRTGTAVARRSVPPASGGGTTIFVPGGYYGNYYPWGYGGFGLGGYYGGYSDPWYYGGPYQGYSYRDGYDGQLRLKVKPREAQVFVDGYFAGIVDDFDGVFQRLHIEPGPHRIEIRDDGYEPLSFEVRILPDRTVTYSGDLKRLTP